MATRSLHNFRILGRILTDLLAGILILAYLVIPGILVGDLKIPPQYHGLCRLVVALILAVLPLAKGDLSVYVRLWHRVRIVAAYILYLPLLPLIYVNRWAPRLGPWWAVMTLGAFLALFLTVRTLSMRPLCDRWLIDLAAFVDEEPPAARSTARAADLVERAEVLQPYLYGRYPAAQQIVNALRDLYADGRTRPWTLLPDSVFRQKMGAACRQLEAARCQPKVLDHRLARTLLARFHFVLSDQGQDPTEVWLGYCVIQDPALTGTDIWGRSRLALGYARMENQINNTRGIMMQYCARQHEVCRTKAYGGTTHLPSADSLWLGATSLFDVAATALSESPYTRIRGANNYADLLLHRLQFYTDTHPGVMRPTESAPATADVPEFFHSGEARLRALREQITILLPTYPRPEYMMTLAQIDFQLAHAALQRAARATDGDTSLAPTARADLRDGCLFLEMALACGLATKEIQKDPHDMCMCNVLAFDLQDSTLPSELASVMAAGQAAGLQVLQRHNVRFRCEVCEQAHRERPRRLPHAAVQGT